jgi:hypothetical protein
MMRERRLRALHSLLPETAKRDLSSDREAALRQAEMILVMWRATPQLLLWANS